MIHGAPGSRIAERERVWVARLYRAIARAASARRIDVPSTLLDREVGLLAPARSSWEIVMVPGRARRSARSLWDFV
jgi:hypothetical protein